MGNFEKLGILVIIILVVVIFVLAVWGVGVPDEELFAEGQEIPTKLSNGTLVNGEKAKALPAEKEGRDGGDRTGKGGSPFVDDDPPKERDDPKEGGGGSDEPDRDLPKPIVHILKKDETFTRLATTYYGSDRYWKEIAGANPSIDPRAMQIGMEVKIPSPELVLGGKREIDTPRRGPVGETPAPAPRSAENYTVRKNDTLWAISQRLGVPFGRLVDVNRDVCPNPDDLQPGMELTIPR
jgi:nucleoid-associated protein YgaU